jgi:hypothetical protein
MTSLKRELAIVVHYCIQRKDVFKQSRINIGSDGTLARGPAWMGLKRGPPIYLNITKQNIRYRKTLG